MSQVQKISEKQKKSLARFEIAAENLDPRIRPLVLGLNTLGYKTLSSCAGHKRDAIPDGYITILGRPNEIDLRNRVGMLGLTHFRFERGKMFTSVEVTTIRFPCLGGSKGDRIIPKLEPVVPEEAVTIVWRLFRRNLHRLGIPIASKQSALIGYALSQALVGKEIRKHEREEETYIK